MENWAWGLFLIAATIGIHAISLPLLVLTLRDIRLRYETHRLGIHRAVLFLSAKIVAVGLLLAILHGIEAIIWAAAYMYLNAFTLREDALLYSLDSMTTRGASGIVIKHWQIMGSLEAADGMLLFGISTAFLFAVMQYEMTAIIESKKTEKTSQA